MNRAALARALRDAGVPGDQFWIEGVHEPAPTPPDFLYLRSVPDGRWEVGVYERGAYEPVATHATEADACAHFRTLV
ncbi:hypothetical protein Q5762_30310 [Streptomyces sp. P9(2023)]|uniref:hypothetical protein n=1 Tax=Streptomyces sp. P9(2023) TaxID=3064394 RepID=UPI0028F40CE4|nr:hypothetical protein [Streptomyces sp. P9(2023)]MDT9692548.1 hypothetical protein [Streptomyces sp. P9(2023)]